MRGSFAWLHIVRGMNHLEHMQVHCPVMQVELRYQPRYDACHELEWQEKLQTSGSWCDADDSADEDDHT